MIAVAVFGKYGIIVMNIGYRIIGGSKVCYKIEKLQ